MTEQEAAVFSKLDKVTISKRAHQTLRQISEEQPHFFEIFQNSSNIIDVYRRLTSWLVEQSSKNKQLQDYFQTAGTTEIHPDTLSWEEWGMLRLHDYITNAGRTFKDINLRNELVISDPIRQFWLAVQQGQGGGSLAFFVDMQMLLRQITKKDTAPQSNLDELKEWMERHPSGLDPAIVRQRELNRNRILRLLIKKIDNHKLKSKTYFFEAGESAEAKFKRALSWWDDKNFHLRFAIRDPETLNEYLDHSLSDETMKILQDARKAGIPFFVNLYYLSLLNVKESPDFAGSDLAIRDYILYSKQLVDEFGAIQAWEKEDKVKPGIPNAAGWILPAGDNIHRRYPEVAILIPDTMGRACGGLCSSCQRMYDFQGGRLNFELDALLPKETWPVKLKKLMEYFEKDKYLKDILITGGDALMSSDNSLRNILEAVYKMALNKQKANRLLPESKKRAEIKRVRLGTRLPVYLPQRINPALCQLLNDFKAKAATVGIEQFVIQTHFETAMEISPEAARAVSMLQQAGWLISNQLVFTTAASRRGHTAKLRKVLNDIGVLTYYTFSVKGYMENQHNFSTNARALQECVEEKYIGNIPADAYPLVKNLSKSPENIQENIQSVREQLDLPFLATDRTVLNMPGVGKSMTFRTIGLTRLGRRILEFEHDHSRKHSKLARKMKKFVIIESKSISEYLEQLNQMGEDLKEYENVFGYSIGQTEPLNPLWKLLKLKTDL